MKLSCKRLIAFLSGLLIGLTSCLCMVVSADSQSNGQDVLNNTRYPVSGSINLDIIMQAIQEIADGEIIDSVNNLSPEDFPKTVATNAYYELNGKATGYQIKDIYACMAKRKIVYPVNNRYEIQYLYVYINGNANATTQQFGNYTIAPNTLFLVRQTSFMGTLAYSIPIVDNNIQVLFGNNSQPCGIVIPQSMQFRMDTSEGSETFVTSSGVTLYISNNTTNSIVNDHLQVVYDYDISHNTHYYTDYLPDGYMNGLEALLGVGIDNSLVDWTSNWRGYNGDGSDQYPFYMTTFFSNNDLGTGSPSFYSTNNNINPSKPPAYIISPDSPLYSGKTITNETINNYADYGITNINGELSINPDILAGALAGLIDPDFNGAFGGVFNAQPEIGLGFDTPLELNLPDLVDDYLQSITVYPPSPDIPDVPPITTYDIVINPVFPATTEALPSYLPTQASNIYSLADRMLSADLMPIYIALALFGLCIAILL